MALTSETDQLDNFSESWNNYKLRTEGLNPVQLWTTGIGMAAPSVTEQPMDDFGIESGQPLNPVDQAAVEVLELNIHLTDVHVQQQLLQNQYLPL